MGGKNLNKKYFLQKYILKGYFVAWWPLALGVFISSKMIS